MQFLELSLQGVRGFSPAVRAALRSGYCLLKTAGANQPPLSGLCSSLLYPDGRGGDAEYKATGQPISRASVTMMAGDQSIFRLVRSLGGAGALQQLNKTSNQFELLSEDPTEIAQFLRSHLGLPTRKAFESVLALAAHNLPSRRQKSAHKTPSAHGLLSPKPGLRGVEPPKDLSTAEAKLAELERELMLSKEVEKIQYRVDGVSSKLFEVEEKLKGTEALKEKIREVEQACRQAPTVESLKLPPDIIERVERFAAITDKYQQSVAKLGSERDDEYDTLPRLLEPVHRRPSFWAAIGFGVACIILGMIIGGSWRYLALLDIPAFGLAAILAINYIDDVRYSKVASRKGERFATREKRIQEEYESESRVIKAATAALQLESPAEIIEALGQRAKLTAELGDLRRQLADYERKPDYASAKSQVAVLKREQDQLNKQLTEKGAYVREGREVEREADRLRASIAGSKAQPAAPAPTIESVSALAPSQPEDPFPALLSVGADLFGTDLQSAGALIKERWFQFFAGLTEQKYQNLRLEKDGKAQLTCNGQPLAAVALPGMDLDLLYLAARFAVIERYCARSRVACLMDDVLVGFDEAKLFLLGRMLKQLGQVTQVLHAASQPGLEQLADASVNV